jgi:hypothetical protein
MRACDYCGQPSVDACITCMDTQRTPAPPVTRCKNCLHLGHDGHEFKSYQERLAAQRREGWATRWCVEPGRTFLEVTTTHPTTGAEWTVSASLPTDVVQRVERLMAVDPTPIYALFKEVMASNSQVPWYDDFRLRVLAFMKSRS